MVKESPLKDKVVLAVDDEPDVIETLRDELDICKVVGKTSYEDAVKYIENNTPDLAILDIMGVNGLELLKLCAENNIPAVMLTANAFTVETLKKSIDLGAKAFFPKEKIGELRGFLEQVMDKSKKQAWEQLFERLGEFFNATFGSDWKKDIIETGPFIVPE